MAIRKLVEPILVEGDWRYAPGGPSSYPKDNGQVFVNLFGGVGLYRWLTGDAWGAIERWLADVSDIKHIEREQRIRLHKGWFYIRLHQAYNLVDEPAFALKYLRLARAEDKRTYGDAAKNFPAAKTV